MGVVSVFTDRGSVRVHAMWGQCLIWVCVLAAGVRMASFGLFLQCLMAVCCSLLMERLLARVGPKALLLSSVAVLALSTAVMTLSHNTVLVTLMAAATGITFCTLQVLPYTLTCLYHSNKEVSSLLHS